MSNLRMIAFCFALCIYPILAAAEIAHEEVGPAIALQFAEQFRGDKFVPDVMHYYPDAVGIPFSDTPSIIEMNASLWRPEDVIADFHGRMDERPVESRKKGIIVVIKTERCATKAMRLCSVTTAALAKQSTPLVGEFAIYGIQIKPRDREDPPSNFPFEEGADSWKNAVAGEYGFRQGPGATLVILSPLNGSKIQASDARRLRLFHEEFVTQGGETPELESFLSEALTKLKQEAKQSSQTRITSYTELAYEYSSSGCSWLIK